MKSCLILVALVACHTEPSPGVCCTTNEDCALLGGIQPRGCPDGYACRNLRCEAATCATDADCSTEQPICDEDSASCTGCTASSDCSDRADAPVCDIASGGCRACVTDAECASEVCDIETGRCVAESAVIYASTIGTDTAGCTRQRPCSVNRAIATATADPSSSLVRLLPGTYSTPLVFTSGFVSVIGTGVSLRAIEAVDVRESAVVEIRGLEIYGYVSSRGTGSLFPSLTVRGSAIRGGYTAMVSHGTLRLLRSSVDPAAAPVVVFDDGALEADRTRFEGITSGGYIAARARRMRVRITNSIFERTVLVLDNEDDAPDRSEYHVSFSTFLFDDPAHIQRCTSPGSHPRSAILENNIFYGANSQVQSVISDFHCTLAGNITHPQEFDLGSTNLDVDPRFVDPAARDYRLQPGSPAVDAAVPSSGPGIDHDFAGTPRPQGARRDIGAFELVTAGTAASVRPPGR